MDKIIPVFYSEYGRYISRFRMIPLNIDGLIPVNRRLLLTMHRIARKTTKSARIVGELIGTLHAHGDSAAYESLVNLVRNGFADSTKSTWGGPGLIDAPAPASRYCVAGDTLITTDRGNIPIKNFFKETTDEERIINHTPFKKVVSDLKVLCHNNHYHNVSHIIYSGYHDIVEVKTKNGVALRCTPNHPLLVATPTGFVWREAQWLTSNDLICKPNNTNSKSNYIYSKVISVTNVGKDNVYDLTVPETHSFTANGYYVHNTETSILPWVDKMGFEYVDYVPWESLELDKEPLYLPSIVPIGLIGGGIHVGLAYHKTVIPKYKKQDLVKRLLWLLRVGKKYKVPDDFSQDLSESEYGPFIAPYKDDCNVVEEEKNAFVKILMSGEGRVSYNPKVMLNESGKNIKLEILGRAPLATFQSLLNDYAKNLLPFTDKPIDQSKKSIHIVASLKRNINVDDFIEDFREKYLNKSVNFKCYFCNLDGVVKQYSIDNILINCFNKWRTASINKLINDVQIVNSKIINNRICTEIRNIIHTHPTVKSIDELIGLFNFSITQTINQYDLDSNSWIASEIRLTDSDVRNVCTTVNIQKLIEYKSIEEKLFEEFNKIKNNIDNYDNYIIHVLKENLK